MANYFEEALIPVNTLSDNPEMRNNVPLVEQLVSINPDAMVAGVITVHVTSPFGKGKGEVLGITPLRTLVATNEVIGLSVATHSTDAGKLTITINSTSSSSTTNLAAFFVKILGRIHPVAVS